jgi:hypothetical protein
LVCRSQLLLPIFCFCSLSSAGWPSCQKQTAIRVYAPSRSESCCPDCCWIARFSRTANLVTCSCWRMLHCSIPVFPLPLFNLSSRQAEVLGSSFFPPVLSRTQLRFWLKRTAALFQFRASTHSLLFGFSVPCKDSAQWFLERANLAQLLYFSCPVRRGQACDFSLLKHRISAVIFLSCLKFGP